MHADLLRIGVREAEAVVLAALARPRKAVLALEEPLERVSQITQRLL